VVKRPAAMKGIAPSWTLEGAPLVLVFDAVDPVPVRDVDPVPLPPVFAGVEVGLEEVDVVEGKAVSVAAAANSCAEEYVWQLDEATWMGV